LKINRKGVKELLVNDFEELAKGFEEKIIKKH